MPTARAPEGDADCDVLAVGAGPTGLALAAQLRAGRASLRLVDAADDRVHESRAPAAQPRTLEVLRPFGVAAELVGRGNRAARLRIVAGRRVGVTPLFDLGAEDTAYPFLLFVSRADTEAVLGRHLDGQEWWSSGAPSSGPVGGTATRCCARSGGRTSPARTCASGTCRLRRRAQRRPAQAGIPFRGGRHPPTLLLAELSADGPAPGAVSAHLWPDGPLPSFPLGPPAPWQLITVRARDAPGPGDRTVLLDEGAPRYLVTCWATSAAPVA